MITAVFLLLFIVFLTSKASKDSRIKGKSFFFRYKTILILLGITLLPTLYINLAHEEGKKLSSYEYLDYLLEEQDAHSFSVLNNMYWLVMNENPNDMEIRIEFIDFVMSYESYGGFSDGSGPDINTVFHK